MTRLTYSTSGFIRSLQMTRAGLNVFVEGRELDSYVYGKLAKAECASSFDYRVIRAEELPAGVSGGKSRLLDCYDRFRRSGKLVIRFKGAVTRCLFFVDKDIDDIKRCKKRSLHVAYTDCYDIEGHLYREGDLVDALAASLSIDPVRVSSAMGSVDWRHQAMESWRAWVTLCVSAQLLQTRTVVNYGVTSQVNPNCCDPADPALVRAHKATLSRACKLPSAERALVYQRAEKIVAERYEAGRADTVFKGKWFPVVIAELAERHFPTEYRRVGGFKQSLTSNLAVSLRPDEPWADPFRERIRDVLALT